MSTQTKTAIVIQTGQGRQMNVLGHAVTIKLSEPETGGAYYVFELVTPPGHGIPPHVHKNEDEVIQVIEGEYEIQLGEQIFQAKAGAVIHFPRYLAHAFRNSGSRPGTTVWTVIPGANFERFFAELGALPAGGPPDMAKVAAIFSKYEIELLPLPVQ